MLIVYAFRLRDTDEESKIARTVSTESPMDTTSNFENGAHFVAGDDPQAVQESAIGVEEPLCESSPSAFP